MKLKITFFILLISVVIVGSLETGDDCSLIDNNNNPIADPCPDLHKCVDAKCKHNTISDYSAREIGGSILMAILSGFATAGGVGGAFLFTPLLVAIFNYSTNGAIRVVYSLVFGGMLANYITKARRKDPKTQRPIINYELAQICLPMLLLGSNIGVLLNRVLPSIVTLIGLVIVMTRAAIKMRKKFLAQYKKEKEESKKKALNNSSGNDDAKQVDEKVEDKEKGTSSNNNENEKDKKLQVKQNNADMQDQSPKASATEADEENHKPLGPKQRSTEDNDEPQTENQIKENGNINNNNNNILNSNKKSYENHIQKMGGDDESFQAYEPSLDGPLQAQDAKDEIVSNGINGQVLADGKADLDAKNKNNAILENGTSNKDGIVVEANMVKIQENDNNLSSADENKEKKDNKEDVNTDSKEIVPVKVDDVKISNDPEDEKKRVKLQSMLKLDQRLFPAERYVDFFFVLAILLFIALLRGTSNFDSLANVELCSAPYWVVYCMIIPAAILLHLRGMYVMKKLDRDRVEVGYDFTGTMRITPDRIPKLRLVALITGVLAAVVGIGGGLLMVPIMMDWGLSSLQATSTSGFFVLFSSFTSVFLVVISGDVDMAEVGFFFAMTFVGSLFISGFLTHLTVKKNKPSILMFTLLILILVSLVVILTFSIKNGIEDSDTLFSGGEVCKR